MGSGGEEGRSFSQDVVLHFELGNFLAWLRYFGLPGLHHVLSRKRLLREGPTSARASMPSTASRAHPGLAKLAPPQPLARSTSLTASTLNPRLNCCLVSVNPLWFHLPP